MHRDGGTMETRVAIIGIIVEDTNVVGTLNEILHEHGSIIIGRMGIPYPKRNISVISIAVDATHDVISSLAGRIGALSGVSVKTAYSNAVYTD